ncbi:MAG: hypothetical protein JWP35_36 [Caulobacter sp.]|nr:hypothetical protein [Caulobacter sp.]
MTGEGISLGDSLGEIVIAVTYARVIRNVAAGRDFMRGHHEPAFAREQGIATIYVNTFFHQALIDRLMTDWGGRRAFIARRKIMMRLPICAGDTATASGRVVGLRTHADGHRLVDLEMAIRNAAGVCCEALGTLAMPGEP